jgi:hypothetical protein
VIATWADRIRPFPQYRWAAPFHYVGGINDWPPSTCLFGEDGWEGKDAVNVLGGIANTTQWLKDGKLGAGEAVKFLIHFLGDLHQPLHLTARERGGNDGEIQMFPLLLCLIPFLVKVHFHNRMASMFRCSSRGTLSDNLSKIYTRFGTLGLSPMRSLIPRTTTQTLYHPLESKRRFEVQFTTLTSAPSCGKA